ncbi:class I SAM-dependent methyltransferase [Oceanihabitans sp. IOP_32]|uniref:class I SAM-dependent methyltransferase n=1 Tax=Oceanihabitans sp. IOP_32 TaxID=2529032 RepID=UPI001293CBBC|nr:class I SAM-dependent methyltransferase [Oceanihabitans sp. IOP_32]QFZ54581.1 class I SAM-dependent methyltransferase [Oceanihabitans sp. IOP_32]
MSFYQQIAPYYHHIFKINEKQVEFITSRIPKSESKILDIGCGIGTLSFELAKHYNNVLGIDMDSEMIRVALNKKENQSEAVQFNQMSMLDLSTALNKHTVGGIVCFGNTLVHLKALDEVADFLQQSKNVLKPKGKLLLQIVNYDRIIENNVKSLPIIDNDVITFKRQYNYRKSENKIDFNTYLTVKSTQQTIKNTVELLPLLKNELEELLHKAGFNNLKYYGSFNLEAYTLNSPALIVEAW